MGDTFLFRFYKCKNAALGGRERGLTGNGDLKSRGGGGGGDWGNKNRGKRWEGRIKETRIGKRCGGTRIGERGGGEGLREQERGKGGGGLGKHK